VSDLIFISFHEESYLLDFFYAIFLLIYFFVDIHNFSTLKHIPSQGNVPEKYLTLRTNVMAG